MSEQGGLSEQGVASGGWRGRALVLVAAVMWSTSGLFAKAPWFDAWPAESRGVLLGFFRSLFAVLALAPIIRRPSFRWPMLPMTVCFAVMVWSFMTAMVYGPAANAIWLQYLSPAWVLLGGVLLLGERLSRADLKLFAFCVSGVLLILAMELSRGGNWFATAMGLLSGVSFAGVVLSIRAMRGVDSAWLITLNHGSAVLLLAPWALPAHTWIEPSSYVALGMFGVLQMSVPYVLFAKGLHQITSAEGSMLILVEPLLVPVWVYLAWHHHPSYVAPPWWTYAGATLICLGLTQRYLPAAWRGMRRPRGVR